MNHCFWVFVLAVIVGAVQYPANGMASSCCGTESATETHPHSEQTKLDAHKSEDGSMAGKSETFGAKKGCRKMKQRRGCGRRQGTHTRGMIGYHTNYGIMHHSVGPGMMGGSWDAWYPPPRFLEKNDARVIVDNYLQSTRNPNLKLGEIKDNEYAFEVEILTKNGSIFRK